MARATIALGSNLGDRLGRLRAGLAGIGRLGELRAVSALYETEPVGGPAQGSYLNAVALIDTELDPVDLLAALHAIEGDSARRRDVRWGPRTLDLDLLTFDDRRISLPDLEVPHPRAHERRFVLAPLLDVAPEVHLADGRSVRDAIGSTSAHGIRRWGGRWPDDDPGLGSEAHWWVAGQFALLAAWLVAVVATARLDSAAWVVAGAVVAGGGVALVSAAVASFGPRVPVSPQPRPGAELVDSGVYRLARHPMYGGVSLVTLGVAIAARSAAGIVGAVCVVVYLRLKSRREEQVLAIAVPAYAAYRESVRRRFIPWVW